MLAEIPGNPIFNAIHVALLDWLIAARPKVPDAELYQHNEVSYRQHIAIVDAIRRRDPDEADRALQTHLNSVSATGTLSASIQKPKNNDPLVKQIAI